MIDYLLGMEGKTLKILNLYFSSTGNTPPAAVFKISPLWADSATSPAALTTPTWRNWPNG
jgi:hypothetical protein